MLIKTKRLEVEYHRGHSLYIGLDLKRGRWETLRDRTGSGLSSTSWTPNDTPREVVEKVV